MELFETHFHLGPDDRLSQVIAEAQQRQVTRFIAVAGDLGDAERLAGIVAAHPNCYSTAGVHPHDAKDFEGDLEPFRRLMKFPRSVAVGEIGLDYYYDYSERPVQRDVFQRFLRLSVEVGKPAIVHCRDAYEDCYAILSDIAPIGLSFEIHSFTGTPDWAEKFLALGAFISFNGIVTFPKAGNVRDALAVVPVERLLLETDSPFLAPVPYRGQTNRPAYLPEIAARIAELKHLDLEAVAAATTENALAFFQVPAI